MKNVSCFKLTIDRKNAPKKMGTLKDISVFGNFTFPIDGEHAGGLIAQSVAGLGKVLKKTKAQIKKLASRESSLAGSTGSSISSELPQQQQPEVSVEPEDLYSIRFISHAPEPVQLHNMEDYPRPSSFLAPSSGYALKKNSGKRVVFTLAQKEIMILFYNRQASTGMRAEPRDVIACMRERGVDVLKEQQIRSWWSTYHQKRKRSLNTLAASQHQPAHTLPSSTNAASQHQPAHTLLTSTNAASQHQPSHTLPTSTIAASQHQPSHTLPTSTIAASQHQPAHTLPTSTNIASQHQPAHTLPTSTIAASQHQPAHTVPTSTNTVSQHQPTHTLPTSTIAASQQSFNVPPIYASPVSMLTGNTVPGIADITEWRFPADFCQSVVGGRSGSNACTFIALYFGHLLLHDKLPKPVGNNLAMEWKCALYKAMKKGNEIHDELFEGEGIDVSAEDAVSMAGTQCCANSVGQGYDLIGHDCEDQLAGVFQMLCTSQQTRCHTIVTTGRTMLFVVNGDGSCMIVDSHKHINHGAVIAYCPPMSSKFLAKWLRDMLQTTWQCSLRVCSVTPIFYANS